jgi:hypothetical protein
MEGFLRIGGLNNRGVSSIDLTSEGVLIEGLPRIGPKRWC